MSASSHHQALGRASRLDVEPWYLPIGDEIELFDAAWQARLPVLLKGPTGCGKTRFIEHMAWRIHRRAQAATPGQGRNPKGQAAANHLEVPLLTVACHEDLTASDLIGRYLLSNDATVWQDGPLTRAVRTGAICYLDEVVEARKDTTVVIHSLTDHRRVLPIDKTGELLDAHPDFLLVISYNPGYQSALKDLKTSTRQRFVALEFDYPPPGQEARIIAHESGVDADRARGLAEIGRRVRQLREQGLEDGVGTRALVHAGALMARGVPHARACAVALGQALTEDPALREAIRDICDLLLP
ncbi:MAG: CbbQ/NirQ/NorQ/GpvN family protein [Burkholderiaceae bacterium]